VEPAEHGHDPLVELDRARNRFVVRQGNQIAELDYERQGDRLTILHTGVPGPLEGKGVGAALVRAAVELAAADDLVIVPRCPFAKRWLESHPDAAASVRIVQP
jgi:uncharacterized protein